MWRKEHKQNKQSSVYQQHHFHQLKNWWQQSLRSIADERCIDCEEGLDQYLGSVASDQHSLRRHPNAEAQHPPTCSLHGHQWNGLCFEAWVRDNVLTAQRYRDSWSDKSATELLGRQEHRQGEYYGVLESLHGHTQHLNRWRRLLFYASLAHYPKNNQRTLSWLWSFLRWSCWSQRKVQRKRKRGEI